MELDRTKGDMGPEKKSSQVKQKSDGKKSETSDQRLWRNTRFLKAVGTGVLLGMSGMGSSVEARPQAPGLALPLEGRNNTTALPPASDQRVRFTGNSLSEGYIPSAKDMEQYRAFLEKMNNPPFYFNPPKDTQAIPSKKTSQAVMETQQDKNKGKDPLSSNGEKIDPATIAHFEKIGENPDKLIPEENTRKEEQKRTPIEKKKGQIATLIKKSLMDKRAAKELGRRMLATVLEEKSTQIVPTAECTIRANDPSTCLDITGSSISAWAEPSSFAVPGTQLHLYFDLLVKNLCSQQVKDMAFQIKAYMSCPADHPEALVPGPSYTIGFHADPTIVDAGATARVHDNATIHCVDSLTPNSDALPTSINLDMWAEGSDVTNTVYSQDKLISIIGDPPSRCPKSPPSPDSPAIPQTPPSSKTPAIPQTPPSPETPATDTPSHRHKGPNVGAVVGGVIGTIVGTGAAAVGCSFKIRHEKHDQVKGQIEITEIGGSVKVG